MSVRTRSSQREDEKLDLLHHKQAALRSQGRRHHSPRLKVRLCPPQRNTHPQAQRSNVHAVTTVWGRGEICDGVSDT